MSNNTIQASKVLILHPSRELAAQCASMLEQLGKFIEPKITHSVIIGGSSMKRQEFELINKPDIIIATPGRLIDILLNSKSIVLNSIEVLVLDEADKLLEMGFRPLIEEILKHIKRESEIENRQTLLLSATLTSGI
jgi:ATP-dependent RNA helicase DDX27